MKQSVSAATAITRMQAGVRAGRLQRVRKSSFRKVVQFVHRCGMAKFVHWGIFEEHMKAFQPISRKKPTDVSIRMGRDHLTSVLVQGGVYSLPRARTDALEQVAGMQDIGEAIAILDAGADGTCFDILKVLDTQVATKKILPRSSLARTLKGMRWLLRIQRLSVWRGVGYLATSYDVCTDVDLENVSILDLAPWLVLRLGLRRWEVAGSDVYSCFAMHSSACPSQQPFPQDIQAASALVCMEEFFRRGWILAKPPVVHTLVSEKHFLVDDLVKHKLYLECLLRLDELLVTHPAGISSRSNVRYYKGILSASAVESKDGDGDDALERPPLQCLADGDVDDEDIADRPPDLDEAARPRPVARCPPLKRLRTAEGISNAPKQAHGLPDLFWGVKDSAIGGSGADVASSSQQPAAAGDAHPDAALAEEAVIVAQEHSDGTPAVHVAERPLPMHIEGQRVMSEAHFGRDARVQFYDRIRIVCPMHQGRCQKTRNVGAAQCRTFGRFEPYGFLGAWLRAGHSYATKAEHIRCTTTEVDVAAYLAEMRWPMRVAD